MSLYKTHVHTPSSDGRSGRRLAPKNISSLFQIGEDMCGLCVAVREAVHIREIDPPFLQSLRVSQRNRFDLEIDLFLSSSKRLLHLCFCFPQPIHDSPTASSVSPSCLSGWTLTLTFLVGLLGLLPLHRLCRCGRLLSATLGSHRPQASVVWSASWCNRIVANWTF